MTEELDIDNELQIVTVTTIVRVMPYQTIFVAAKRIHSDTDELDHPNTNQALQRTNHKRILQQDTIVCSKTRSCIYIRETWLLIIQYTIYESLHKAVPQSMSYTVL